MKHNGIEIAGVSKNFGITKALQEVNITFEEHKIYGLLGRNGAGKSTLLNVINNRLFADTGQVMLNGEAVRENDAVLQHMYLMNEQMLYPSGMKIKEAFRWSKSFYPQFDTDYALNLAKQFGLDIKKAVKELSTGYASIFKNIIALSVNVPFVLLDEPVLGLDANHRELFYKILIEKYAKEPFTAVISTHIIEEVSGVVEDIVIIKEGRIIRSESRESLLAGGYTVSGKAGDVDSFVIGRDVIGMDVLGGLRTAYIMGTPDKSEISGTLEIGRMDLQKIFIQLTNS